MMNSLRQFDYDRYIIQDKIGEGTFGEIYKSYDRITKKLVAIKKIPKSNQNFNEELFESFKAEVDTLIDISLVGSPYIVNLLDFRTHENYGYIVLDLYEQSLRQLLRKERNLSEEKVLKIIKQIANAFIKVRKSIDFKKEFMHRDIKPENIMIKNNGDVALTDFGLGKIASTSSMKSSYGTAMVGSFNYMAPEVLLGKKYNVKCDVYSTGLIAYECLFGDGTGKTLSAYDVEELIKKWTKIPIQNISRDTQNLLIGMLKNNIERLDWDQILNHPALSNIQLEMKGQEIVKEVTSRSIIKEDTSQILSKEIVGQPIIKESIQQVISKETSKKHLDNIALSRSVRPKQNPIDMIKEKLKMLEKFELGKDYYHDDSKHQWVGDSKSSEKDFQKFMSEYNLSPIKDLSWYENLPIILNELENLKVLTINLTNYSKVSDQLICQIAEALSTKQNIIEFNFSLALCQDIKDKSIRALANVIKSQNNLMHFNLDLKSCDQISDDSIIEIAYALQNKKDITHFSLNLYCCNLVSNDSIANIAKALMDKQKIIDFKLNLYNTQVTSEIKQVFEKIIKAQRVNVRI